MTFRELEQRLLARLRSKVGQGEISERQLARLTGYTQSHIHNVLKGARGGAPQLMDAALRCLQLSVEDLLRDTLPRVDGASRYVMVPLWSGLIGPRHRFPEPADAAGFHLFPGTYISRFVEPVLLRLADDEDSMSPLIEPGDVVLVDRSEESRRHPVFEQAYVLSLWGRGFLRRCQRVGNLLVLIADNPRRAFRMPDRLPLERRDILEVVRGRIVWICRELD